MTDPAEDDRDETIANLRCDLREAEKKLARIAKAVDEGGLNSIALDVARAIDDVYAQGHGGTAQRLARVQNIIREEMRANVDGAANWQYRSCVSNTK